MMLADPQASDRTMDGDPPAERHHHVRTPDGSRATLVTPQRPYASRRDRLRIRRLARRRMELEHPALLGVRAIGEEGGQPYLVTDPYPQRTFADILEKEAPLERERVVGMLAPVADAMDLAHSCGLVHQAFDADSLLVEGDRLVLDSFAILAGGGSADKSANVRALANLIAFALRGKGPSEHSASGVSGDVPQLGHEVDAVLEWGMSTKPAWRPKSAAELVEALAYALPTLDVVDVTKGGDGAPSRARGSSRASRLARSIAPFAATAAAVVLAAVCGAFAAERIDPFGSDASSRLTPTGDQRAWGRLADRRPELRGELAVAKTPQQQSVAASKLARAYADAADAARPGRLAAAARETSDAYSRLAGAAKAVNEKEFAASVAAVERAERRVVAAHQP